MSIEFNNFSETKPFLNFSESKERASLVDSEFDSEFMPSTKSGLQRKKQNKSAKKNISVTSGKVFLRVPGYSGIQKLIASSLIPFIPVRKLKLAAKKVLKRSGVAKKIKRRKNKNKNKNK